MPAPAPVSVDDRQAMRAHHSAGHEVILAPDHQPLRHDTEPAHMDVQRKHLYTLALKKGGCERNDRRVRCSQKFFHSLTKRQAHQLVEPVQDPRHRCNPPFTLMNALPTGCPGTWRVSTP